MTENIIKEWFLNVPWGKLAMISQGDPSKPPVLLIHGYMDTAATFLPLMAALPPRYHYVTFDLPGQGHSDTMPGPPISPLHLVEAVRQIVEQMRWDTFYCIAHSMGYVTTLQLLHTHGYHYQRPSFHTYQSQSDTSAHTYHTSQPQTSYDSHTYDKSQPHGAHTYDISQPQTSYDPHTYGISQPQGAHTYDTSQPQTSYDPHTYRISQLQGAHTHDTSQPQTNYGPHTYGISQPLGAHTYDISQPASFGHFELSQPQTIVSHTFESSQSPDGETSPDSYSWMSQWHQKVGWVTPNDGTYGLSQDNTPSQENIDEIFKPHTIQKPTEDINHFQSEEITKPTDDINHFQSEEITKPTDDINHFQSEEITKPIDDINDDTDDSDDSPALIPSDTNDDDDYSESSGDVLDDTTTPTDIKDDKPADGISNSFSNTAASITKPDEDDSEDYTKPTPPRKIPLPYSPIPTYAEPIPGTMSFPVPKLGLLFAPSLQWHVGIYSKRFTPYMQVCGGSLVKYDVVLSAAHCFWDDNVGPLRPGLFAVAAGKLLRPWETEGEIYTQHSEVRDIKIPPRFRGIKTSFQDDIAVVLLSSSLEPAPGVKPVCVTFDPELERKHLRKWNLGTIAGWGLTEPNGPPSQRLNYQQLPYVEIEECLHTADESFQRYITSDKICAGDQKTGRALCRGDSGGGLIFNSAFPPTGNMTPFLHGIASTAPRDANECNAYAVATFTNVQAHRRFLNGYVLSDEECKALYRCEPQDDTTVNPELTGPAIVDQLLPSQNTSELTNRGPMWETSENSETTEYSTEKTDNSETSDISTETSDNSTETSDNSTETSDNSTETSDNSTDTSAISTKTSDISTETSDISTETSDSKEKEVLMNVGSGERGVARVVVDNDTRTFVCSCYCNK